MGMWQKFIVVQLRGIDEAVVFPLIALELLDTVGTLLLE